MALFTFQPDSKINNTKKKKKQKEKEPHNKHPPTTTSSSSSWDQIKNLLHCKQTQVILSTKSPVEKQTTNTNGSSTYSCKSICRFGDIVHGNTRVVHRADNSPEGSSVGVRDSLKKKIINQDLTTGRVAAVGSHRSSVRSVGGGGGRGGGGSCGPSGLQFRKLSGCYECHTVVDPSRYPLPRRTVCACTQCGEVFPKTESLEHHQAIRHAVSELGPDDSGRNIVEIIFKSSWMKKDTPVFNIERILKIHNTNRTIQRFEDCRDAIKLKAKKNARCAADGNELLRFYCTTLMCTLGARNASSLCSAIPGCNICTLIRYGFQPPPAPLACMTDGVPGVFTAAGSGRAHDEVASKEKRRAMIVCRVVAGRVMRREATCEDQVVEEVGNGMSSSGGVVSSTMGSGNFDSFAGRVGIYSDLEELIVFNPKAILPCFVVVYTTI